MTMTDTVQTAAPPDGVRGLTCSLCLAVPGSPCRPAGDHLARWLRAYAAGLVTRDELAAVIRALVVITKWCIIPDGSR